QYLADAPDPQAAAVSIAAAIALPEELQFAARPPAERLEARRRVVQNLARAYLNLGVMHAQGGRFARAAEFFEEAARIDPMFPQVQYSLGVAYFNAQRYDKAVTPLSRAFDADPHNAMVRPMLGVASVNV